MTEEQEAIKILDGATREEYLYHYEKEDRPYLIAQAENTAVKALEEIQQLREYKNIFESYFSKEALELLSD